MKEKTIEEAYVTIKRIGFEKFCKSLMIGGNCCPIWLEGIKHATSYCEYCQSNREKVLKELDAKFRKQKLEKLLNG